MGSFKIHLELDINTNSILTDRESPEANTHLLRMTSMLKEEFPNSIKSIHVVESHHHILGLYDYLKSEWLDARETLHEGLLGVRIYTSDLERITSENFPEYMYDMDRLDDSDGEVSQVRWTAGRLWQLKEILEHLQSRYPDLPDPVDLYA